MVILRNGSVRRRGTFKTMRVASALLLLVVACAAKSSTEAVQSNEQSPGALPSSATPCAFGGNYRLREDVAKPNTNRIWFRFHVDDSATPIATVDNVTARLFDVSPALVVTVDRAACTLAAVAKRNDGRGTVAIALHVEANNAVTGSVTEPAPYATGPLVMSGVRDVGVPKVPAPCFVPGMYLLEFTPQTVWVTHGDKDWPSGCGAHPPKFEKLRVEPILDDIAVLRAGGLTPDEPLLGYDTSTRHGCEVALELRQGNIELDAVLAFFPGFFVGTVTRFRHGDADGSYGDWVECTTTDALVSGHFLSTLR